VKRAIKKSDVLMKEIFDRLEGRIVPSDEAVGHGGVQVIILDVPRPDRSAIDVKPPVVRQKPTTQTEIEGRNEDPRPKD